MESYRNPKYVERYEDVIFELETPLNSVVANNRSQKKDGYRFVVDNSGEVTPFDWYNARIGISFKVNKLADGTNIAGNDQNGIVNSIHSFIRNFDIKLNGKKVYDCNDANHCVILTKLQLIVPRITFNSEGQSMYMDKFLKPYKWSYLRENIERSNSTTQRAGHFKISSGISKPRHVFVFIINDAAINSQTSNPFLYNTFSVSTDPRTLQNCHLEVGNGNEYPEIHYTPATDLSRVYRDVLKYVHKNSEYSEGSLLNISNFQTLFPFLYFNLTKQKADIRDGTTKLTFRYELSGTTAAAYSVYALTLYEQEAELVQQNGKLLFR